MYNNKKISRSSIVLQNLNNLNTAIYLAYWYRFCSQFQTKSPTSSARTKNLWTTRPFRAKRTQTSTLTTKCSQTCRKPTLAGSTTGSAWGRSHSRKKRTMTTSRPLKVRPWKILPTWIAPFTRPRSQFCPHSTSGRLVWSPPLVLPTDPLWYPSICSHSAFERDFFFFNDSENKIVKESITKCEII